jgi:hypothetical protein
LKAILALLVFAWSSLGWADDLRQIIRAQWERVQSDLKVVQLLDAKKFEAAGALFARVRTKDAAGDIVVTQYFSERKYAEARDSLNRDIDGWIIQEAGHSQRPALTVLLDNPERLKFLQQLAVHRKKFPPAPPPGRKKPYEVVSEALDKAVARGE